MVNLLVVITEYLWGGARQKVNVSRLNGKEQKLSYLRGKITKEQKNYSIKKSLMID